MMRAKIYEIVGIYWELVRIVAPVTIMTQILMETGVIAALSPVFQPLMSFYGLPQNWPLRCWLGCLSGSGTRRSCCSYWCPPAI